MKIIQASLHTFKGGYKDVQLAFLELNRNEQFNSAH